MLSELHSFNLYKNINPWENSWRLKVLSSHRIPPKNILSPPLYSPLYVFKVIHKSSFYVFLNLSSEQHLSQGENENHPLGLATSLHGKGSELHRESEVPTLHCGRGSWVRLGSSQPSSCQPETLTAKSSRTNPAPASGWQPLKIRRTPTGHFAPTEKGFPPP